MSDLETVELPCPQCQTINRVGQVQGDRCPGCGFEFKWFGPGEQRTAEDYHRVLTGTKHLVVLAPGLGFIVAHE